MKLLSASLTILANIVAVRATSISGISAVSWGSSRMDLFGANDDKHNTIWHKYFTGYGWEPTNKLENMGGSVIGPPVATSWAQNRLDFLFVNPLGNVSHKYWTGTEWGPSSDGFEDLGKGPVSRLATNSWGSDRIDIAGVNGKGNLLHKAWTGSDWYPAGQSWSNFGGALSNASAPALVSPAPGTVHIFAISDKGSVLHKYWDGGQWVPSGKDWEDFGDDGDKGFVGDVVATSRWGTQLSVWAISKATGELWQKSYYGDYWRDWENLGGGPFESVKVAHWDSSRIDILGESPEGVMYKFWTGSQWSDWALKGEKLTSPALLSLQQNNLNLFALSPDGNVVLQVWDGSQWLPSYSVWYDLGATSGLEEASMNGPGKTHAAEGIKEVVMDGVRLQEAHVELRFAA